MSKFSNYIKMRKNFGDTIYMEIDVTLKTSNGESLNRDNRKAWLM